MGILDQVDRATEIESRTPFLPKGVHKVAIQKIYRFESKKNGESVAAEVLLLESDNPQAKILGTYVQFFLVSAKPKWVGDQTQLDNLVSFCGKLAGATTLDESKKATKDILNDQTAQPARGAVIVVDCYTQHPKVPKIGADGKPIGYHKQRFEAVAQTMEEIASVRAELDASYPLVEKTVMSPPVAQPSPAAGLLGAFGRR